MSDVQPSDAAVEAAIRAVHIRHEVWPCQVLPGPECSMVADARAALVAGLAVEYAALADKIETWSAIKAGSGAAYTDGLRDAARMVRAAAGGAP